MRSRKGAHSIINKIHNIDKIGRFIGVLISLKETKRLLEVLSYSPVFVMNLTLCVVYILLSKIPSSDNIPTALYKVWLVTLNPIH